MGFQNEHLSFSRLSRYEQCPLAFRLHYIDRLKAAPGLPLLFGKAIHAVLETLLTEIIDAKVTGPLLEEHAIDLWKAEWASESGLSGIAAFHEGVEILRDFCRDEGVVSHRNVLAAEGEFRLQIGRFAVVGALDRVNRIDDTTVEVVDFKTNRLLFTREEVDTSLQMSLYHLAAQELWPWAKKIQLTFHMLRHSIRMQTERTPAQLQTAKAYVEALGEEIERTTAFPARLNPNCVYCDHREQCPVYAEALRGKRYVVAMDLSDLAAVAREREEVASIAKLAYARKGELEAVLRARLENDDELAIGGRKYTVYTVANTAYPFEATIDRLVERTGTPRDEVTKRVAVIDKGALDDFLKDARTRLPRSRIALLRAEVDATAQRTFTQRFSSKADHS
jgi:putative RecB family exonuclease